MFEPLPPRISRARACHEHLGQSLGDVGFIAAVAFKGLGMELAFPIAGDFEIFEPPRGGHQITGIGAIAIPFAAAGYIRPKRLQ